jgi:hypothetical protein
MAVGESFNHGESLENLMKRYGVSADTILTHLTRFIRAGNVLSKTDDLEKLSNLKPEEQQKVFEAFNKLGLEALKPVYDKFNGSVGYDELKLLRLCYLKGKVLYERKQS